MTTFVDTNVVIALLDADNAHHNWCVEKLNEQKQEGPAIVSDIVYCEVSVGMSTLAEVDEAILQLGLERIGWNDQALFHAGRAFKQYKHEHGGPKLGVLPDFLIGAIAHSANAPLMTANPREFATYFPEMTLITPT